MVTTHDAADNGAEPPDELLWNIKTVIAKTGLSRPSIYRYMKRGHFPPRRRIGPNRVAWIPSEVMAWIDTCPCLPRVREGPRDRLPNAATVRPEQRAAVCDGGNVDASSFDPERAARSQS